MFEPGDFEPWILKKNVISKLFLNIGLNHDDYKGVDDEY
jgi:hypothetical protein